MKKLCLLTALIVLCFASLAGAPVNEEVALEVGQKWLQYSFPGSQSRQVESNLAVEKDGLVLYYIISCQGGGWVLVAADDASMPILGYSDNGRFEYPITCPAVVYWMGIYERQLETAIRENHSNAQTLPAWNEIRTGLFGRWDATRDVLPLLQTTWNQDWPYNNSCPYDAAGPGNHAYAGCVATAMGQVMKYWNHPSAGSISHTYTHPTYGSLSANFASTSYNWAGMPNSISSVDTDITTLLYHCGVGVEMNYGPSASGALVFTNDAMETFFGYDPAAHWDYRSNYPTTWTSMMRSDLDLGRPVIYNGYESTQQIGHSFVMDGYRTSQADFHFNFGWGGSYNGYFTLNNIIPYPGFDFSYGQWAYFNLYPGLNISGQITDNLGSPISGATIDFTNTRASVSTNASGQYSKAVSSGYTGTATPSYAGYSFTPSSRSYASLYYNQTNQNYTGSAAVPADPSNLLATAIAYDKVQLNWTDNSSNETGFLIECQLLPDLTWYYRNTVPYDVIYYLDTNLMPSQTYNYRVTAFNGAGNSNPAYAPPVTTFAPPPPMNLSVPVINFTDVSVDWIEQGSAPNWDIEYGPPGFAPGTGILIPLLPNHPAQISGLQQGTTYDWYVRSFYPSVNVYSAWAGPGNFTTQGVPMLPYPWFEGFEAGLVNMVNDANNLSLWQLDTTLMSEGIQSVWNAYQPNASEILVCAGPFDLSPAMMPTLYFDHIAKLENDWDHGYVEVSVDGGLSWWILQLPDYRGAGNYVPPQYNNPEGECFMSSSYPEWGGSTPDNSWWKTEEFDLSPYMTPMTMIRFRLKSDSSVQQYGWLIDNVKVMEKPQYSFNLTAPADANVGRGLSYDYLFTLNNTGMMPDTYNVGIDGIGAWTYGLYEADGSSPLTLPLSVPPMASYNFVLKVTTPSTGWNNFDLDPESVSVFSQTTGTGHTCLVTTMVLFGDTIADAIVIGSLPFTDNSASNNYNHDFGPYGDGSGLTGLINPYTSYFSGTLSSSPDVVYQLVLTSPTLLSIDLAGSGYDTAVALVSAPGTAPGDVRLINDDYSGLTSYVDSGCSYVPAGTYYIIVGGYSANSGTYTLNVAAATPPVQPTVTVQLDIAADQVILSWTQNPLMRYDVFSDTNPFGSYSTQEASNLNAGTCTISPIPSPMKFYKVVEKFCFSYPSKDSLIPIDPVKKE